MQPGSSFDALIYFRIRPWQQKFHKSNPGSSGSSTSSSKRWDDTLLDPSFTKFAQIKSYKLCVFRPHLSTTYVDEAYSCRPSIVVCRSVCHTSETCKNGCTNRVAVWVEDLGGPGEPRIRWGSRSPHGKGQILGENGRPIVKYRDTLRSSVQRRLNR